MIYDYKCSSCENVWEVWKKLSEPQPSECPKCQSKEVAQVINATAFALKGSGWYTTDYKKSAPPAKSEGGDKSEAVAGCAAPACGTGACAAGDKAQA